MNDLLDKKKLEAFRHKVQEMALQEFGTTDCCDPRVEVVVVDRSRTEPLHFVPVPYEHKASGDEEWEAIRSAVSLNLHLAFARWDTCERLGELRRREGR